jgi:DNA-binding NarL/FixJ family response regulator
MDTCTKIFVIDKDCAKLVNLMLCLDQFPEFEIVGLIDDARNLSQQISDNRPDIILLDIASVGTDAVSALLSLKESPTSPAVVVMGKRDKTARGRSLMSLADAYLKNTASIKELGDLLGIATNKRRAAFASLNMPKTKAG